MERYLRTKLKGGVFKNVDQKRSRVMSRIRSKGNKTTEAKLRYALVRAGISGWSMHPHEVFGKPDFYFHKEKLAVFVDGCFWHGCLKCGHIPKTRSCFWSAKFERNRQRSIRVKKTLSRSGIRVLRFWEHELHDAQSVIDRLDQLFEGD